MDVAQRLCSGWAVDGPKAWKHYVAFLSTNDTGADCTQKDVGVCVCDVTIVRTPNLSGKSSCQQKLLSLNAQNILYGSCSIFSSFIQEMWDQHRQWKLQPNNQSTFTCFRGLGHAADLSTYYTNAESAQTHFCSCDLKSVEAPNDLSTVAPGGPAIKCERKFSGSCSVFSWGI